MRTLHPRTAGRFQWRSTRFKPRATKSRSLAAKRFAANIRYLGVCCGAGPHHIRALAEALGRRPPASRFSPDMSKHYALGTDPRLKPENREYAVRL